MFKNLAPCIDANAWQKVLSVELFAEVEEVEGLGPKLANFPFTDVDGVDLNIEEIGNLDGCTVAVEFNLVHSSAMGKDQFIAFLEKAKVVIQRMGRVLSPEV